MFLSSFSRWRDNRDDGLEHFVNCLFFYGKRTLATTIELKVLTSKSCMYIFSAFRIVSVGCTSYSELAGLPFLFCALILPTFGKRTSTVSPSWLKVPVSFHWQKFLFLYFSLYTHETNISESARFSRLKRIQTRLSYDYFLIIYVWRSFIISSRYCHSKYASETEWGRVWTRFNRRGLANSLVTPS